MMTQPSNNADKATRHAKPFATRRCCALSSFTRKYKLAAKDSPIATSKMINSILIKILPTLCLVLVFSLLLCLGFWQLNRAAYKTTLLQQWQQRQQQPPIAWSQQGDHTTVAEGTRLQVQGSVFSQQSLLLDNRVHQGQVGVDVISPLQLADGSLLLVNRGWIPWPWPRDALPALANITEPVNWTVTVKTVPKPFVLQADQYQPAHFPMLIQALPTQWPPLWTQPVQPIYVRLQPDQPHGFVRDWVNNTISPARHQAYAIQWFALAGCAVLIFIRAQRHFKQRGSQT